MAPNDWEYTYNGFTFGGNLTIGVNRVEGLDPPDVRVDSIDKPEDHGSWSFGQYLDARTITFEGDAAADMPSGAFETLMNQLRQAFVPQASPLPLQFKRPGLAVQRINCIPIKVDFPFDTDYSIGIADWTVMLLADDPRIYSDTLYNTDVTVFLPNGMSFSTSFSINFLGGTGGGGGITSAGIFSTWPLIYLYGPITTPKLTSLTANKFLQFDLSLGASDYLVVDTYARTVLLNGFTSRYSALNGASQWFPILAGSNTFKFEAFSAGAGAKATIQWRDAWI